MSRQVDLDGPVAAPQHHRVLFENDAVRVVETIIPVGETTEVHTHLAPHLTYFRRGDRYVRRDPAGAVVHDTASAGPPFMTPTFAWSDGTPAHTLENAGSVDLELLLIELKGARVPKPSASSGE